MKNDTEALISLEDKVVPIIPLNKPENGNEEDSKVDLDISA